ILDDEYAQGIEIRSVSSHTVWGIGSRDPACRDKLTRAVENKSCSFCNFLALGTQRAALGLKRSRSKIARPRPSPPNSRAVPSLPWGNACSFPQVTNDAFEMVCHRARKMSFSRRSVGILVFRVVIGEKNGTCSPSEGARLASLCV